MPSKAITQNPETRPGSSWRNQPDTGPSMMRSDDPKIARGIGLAGAAAILVGGMAMGLHTAGRVTPLGVGSATFLLTIGIAGLLFHAAFDGDVQIRRVYMGFGYLCLLLGGFLTIVRFNNQVGALFGQGFLCMFLGLLFLLAFLRNEDDAWMRKLAENIIGAAGVVMALVGLVGGNVRGEFLLPIGVLVAVLGLIYLTAFVGSRGIGDDLAYRAGLGIGILGVLTLLLALGRSILPPLFYRWHWQQTMPEPYFTSYGVILTILGILYVCDSLLLCSENRLVVLTRRELGSLFYSPVAYILLFVFVLFHWLTYAWPVAKMVFDNQAVPEPLVSQFILQWAAVISTIITIPVLTMRLMSEEKRSGTLEVLLTAPVNEGEVILSKFLAAYVIYLVMWLPFGFFLIYLRVMGGSPFDYRPLFSFTIGQLATGAGLVALGLFFSCLTRNQVASGILGFAGTLILSMIFMFERLLSMFVELSTEPLRSQLQTWQNVLKHMSYIQLWQDSLAGQLYFLQIIFFVSLAVIFLFLSIKVVEARKWT